MNEKLIEKFQCPGCVAGSNVKCGHFKPENHYQTDIDDGFFCCQSHVLGTLVSPPGHHVALGLPKGFNRAGDGFMGTNEPVSQMVIRIWARTKDGSINAPKWDVFNVPVWALEEDGFLFVRTYMPRTNRPAVDVIEGGTLALVPKALNVAEFYGDMD